ncbi:MAG: type III-B CRISPR module RAMP protein Cmr6 [Anaerolineae bacterium]|nr:type III-B CRISPR module RAMP protein Cmr6 [Anaerolineae bacterium]
MAYHYLLPSDTARVHSNHIQNCRNFALTVQRYMPHEASMGKERNFWLSDICKDFKPDTDLITSTRDRWLAMTEGAACFTMVTHSRLIVGLGGKGALEFGITLHRVTGLPYIPGSALKGLCRNYTLYYIAEQSNISLDPAQIENISERAQQLDEQLSGVEQHGFNIDPAFVSFYQNLFGTQGQAGNCVFYDAIIDEIPGNQRLFVAEVMTPHFGEYYKSSGKEAPNDADKPIPVTYLAVNAGIAFHFAIGLRKNAPPETPRGDARAMLYDALYYMGIGAKTAAGYGIFKPVESSRSS